MPARPAEHLVHGMDSPVVIVSGRVAAYLERYANLDAFRRENRGADAEIDQALIALHIAALRWRDSATGSREATRPEVGTQSEWISTNEAATAVGLRSDRAIRYAIKAGRLRATRHNKSWRIHRDDLAHYKAARAAEKK